jgi:hypothetical protein
MTLPVTTEHESPGPDFEAHFAASLRHPGESRGPGAFLNSGFRRNDGMLSPQAEKKFGDRYVLSPMKGSAYSDSP